MIDDFGLPEGRGSSHPEDSTSSEDNDRQAPPVTSSNTPQQESTSEGNVPLLAPHHEDALPEHAGDTIASRKRFSWHWPPTKKQWLYGSAVVLVLAAGSATSAYLRQPLPPPPVQPYVKPAPPKPTTVPSTLTGLPVDPSVNNRPVTGVMIENSTLARPQSGLDQAGVVFEAIAEGGITRFLALYQDTQPSYLGPVRSARPYYEQWALGFDAGYAHVGGSPEALQDIKNWHVRDLDQFFNAGAYHRINSRYAPHNVYTSIASLNALEKSKGYTSSTFTGFLREPLPNSSTTPKIHQPVLPNATSVDLGFSGPDYNVHYAYDSKSQTYKRYEGGQPHLEIDAKGHQTQIAPKVVLALVMPYRLESDGYHSYYNTLGSGKLYVFQNGTVEQGTWHKASANDQFTFTDDQGQPLPLIAGQTWVSAMANASDIAYK